MNNTIVLCVGDTYHLKPGRDRIIYAAMLSDEVYSIVQMKNKGTPLGIYGYGWNLYFKKDRSTIRIDEVNILVEDVTDGEIRIRV